MSRVVLWEFLLERMISESPHTTKKQVEVHPHTNQPGVSFLLEGRFIISGDFHLGQGDLFGDHSQGNAEIDGIPILHQLELD